MNNISIKDINIKLDTNQSIIATPNMFDNLYISNINDSGDEIAFTPKENSNRLKANFFMIKLNTNSRGINFKLKCAGRKLNTGGKANDKTYFMGY